MIPDDGAESTASSSVINQSDFVALLLECQRQEEEDLAALRRGDVAYQYDDSLTHNVVDELESSLDAATKIQDIWSNNTKVLASTDGPIHETIAETGDDSLSVVFQKTFTSQQLAKKQQTGLQRWNSRSPDVFGTPSPMLDQQGRAQGHRLENLAISNLRASLKEETINAEDADGFLRALSIAIPVKLMELDASGQDSTLNADFLNVFGAKLQNIRLAVGGLRELWGEYRPQEHLTMLQELVKKSTQRARAMLQEDPFAFVHAAAEALEMLQGLREEAGWLAGKLKEASLRLDKFHMVHGEIGSMEAEVLKLISKYDRIFAVSQAASNANGDVAQKTLQRLRQFLDEKQGAQGNSSASKALGSMTSTLLPSQVSASHTLTEGEKSIDKPTNLKKDVQKSVISPMSKLKGKHPENEETSSLLSVNNEASRYGTPRFKSRGVAQSPLNLQPPKEVEQANVNSHKSPTKILSLSKSAKVKKEVNNTSHLAGASEEIREKEGVRDIDGFASCRLDPDFVEDFSIDDPEAGVSATAIPGRIFPWRDHVTRTRAVSPNLKTQKRSTQRKYLEEDKDLDNEITKITMKTESPQAALQQSRMVVVSTPTNMFAKILRDREERHRACGSTPPPEHGQPVWNHPPSKETNPRLSAELIQNHHNVRSASGHQRSVTLQLWNWEADPDHQPIRRDSWMEVTKETTSPFKEVSSPQRSQQQCVAEKCQHAALQRRARSFMREEARIHQEEQIALLEQRVDQQRAEQKEKARSARDKLHEDAQLSGNDVRIQRGAHRLEIRRKAKEIRTKTSQTKAARSSLQFSSQFTGRPSKALVLKSPPQSNSLHGGLYRVANLCQEMKERMFGGSEEKGSSQHQHLLTSLGAIWSSPRRPGRASNVYNEDSEELGEIDGIIREIDRTERAANLALSKYQAS